MTALARSGNKQAFDALLERYQAMATRIAQGMVGQEEIARELVQEAFLAAYLSLHQLRSDTRRRFIPEHSLQARRPDTLFYAAPSPLPGRLALFLKGKL